MNKVFIIVLISAFLTLVNFHTLKAQNIDHYAKNINAAIKLYSEKKNIPKPILLKLVPKNYTEFGVYYGTTYPDQGVSEISFFYDTSKLIFRSAFDDEDFYLPSLQLISFADGEFAEEFTKYLELIIENDKDKFCNTIQGKKYVNHNPIKYYSELYGCTFDQNIRAIKATQEKDVDFFDYEDYEQDHNGILKPVGDLVFLKGCNWYCGGTVSTITATSELATQSDNTYTAENTHDFDHNTAWIEGKEDYGIGESITYTIDFRKDAFYEGHLGINELIIANGYKKSKKAWQANSRIKKLRMYINNIPSYDILLKDSFEIQTVAIDTIMFPKNHITEITFEIREVYEGTIYKDTALSLLMFDGVGVH
ncbi:hypothetical protein [uncultured Dokdonia sp.]|uniref:NADase-type glycan-binding domain-containing protein n=1 Tax=uncultured Dokdonia sp. TaxID=575653 RepID=UPI002607F78A|nr:hypothetical protein [uncultured Dokdonia sp.]